LNYRKSQVIIIVKKDASGSGAIRIFQESFNLFLDNENVGKRKARE
jgi:hypothetical protein